MTHVNDPVAGSFLKWNIAFLEAIAELHKGSMDFPSMTLVGGQGLPQAEGIFVTVGGEVNQGTTDTQCTAQIEIALTNGGMSRAYEVREAIMSEFNKFRAGEANNLATNPRDFGLRLKSLNHDVDVPPVYDPEPEDGNSQDAGTRTILGYTFRGMGDASLIP